jgi:hypothetical protein
MNRAKANSLTRRVQVLALLFAAGAVVAGVIPMTASSGPVVPLPPPIQLKAAEAPVEVSAPALATAIDAIAPPVVIKDQPKTEVVTPPPPPSAWKYLGAIISGSYKRAVVIVNDRQHLVAEGTKVDDTEVVEIDSAYIKIKDAAGAEQMIELAARQKTQLTIAGPTAGAGRQMPGAAPVYTPPGKGGGGMTPEMAARVAKAAEELRGVKGLSPEDRREKLRGMVGQDVPEGALDAATAGGGRGKGGK